MYVEVSLCIISPYKNYKYKTLVVWWGGRPYLQQRKSICEISGFLCITSDFQSGFDQNKNNKSHKTWLVVCKHSPSSVTIREFRTFLVIETAVNKPPYCLLSNMSQQQRNNVNSVFITCLCKCLSWILKSHFHLMAIVQLKDRIILYAKR